MICAVTPTGGRPEAFAECCRMMYAQNYREPFAWLVLDDGQTATPPPLYGQPDNLQMRYVHVAPPDRWKPGQNTQARNMKWLLEGSGDMPVVIIEDDDRYAPWWLSRCAERLETHDLVGERNSLYLHRNSGRRAEMKNQRHASLCSTAMKGSAKDFLIHICERQKSRLDVDLWREFPGPKMLYDPEPRGVTGIKGWPGRPGIGVGHRLQ